MSREQIVSGQNTGDSSTTENKAQLDAMNEKIEVFLRILNLSFK